MHEEANISEWSWTYVTATPAAVSCCTWLHRIGAKGYCQHANTAHNYNITKVLFSLVSWFNYCHLHAYTWNDFPRRLWFMFCVKPKVSDDFCFTFRLSWLIILVYLGSGNTTIWFHPFLSVPLKETHCCNEQNTQQQQQQRRFGEVTTMTRTAGVWRNRDELLV